MLWDPVARAGFRIFTVPDGILRLNCTRARSGWPGDLIPLARAYLRGEAVPRDEKLAVRLLELAVSRGHPRAKWELSILLRNGVGIERNHTRALELAKAAADEGDATGMNVLGVMIRDGVGRQRDDAEARIWFERAADLLDTYAMVNLGRFHRDGRGGLTMDPAVAVALGVGLFSGRPLGGSCLLRRWARCRPHGHCAAPTSGTGCRAEPRPGSKEACRRCRNTL